MINTMTSTNQTIDTLGASVLVWDVSFAKLITRPANHNLTRAARETNVVPLGRGHSTDDFRPDLGARLVSAS